jgi:hypothetical protein
MRDDRRTTTELGRAMGAGCAVLTCAGLALAALCAVAALWRLLCWLVGA